MEHLISCSVIGQGSDWSLIDKKGCWNLCKSLKYKQKEKILIDCFIDISFYFFSIGELYRKSSYKIKQN